MCRALKAAQREDGFWNASLHDPTHYGGKETTGTSLFIYGFFLDHNIDCINEMMMFGGVGLSPLMNIDITLVVLAIYLMLSVSVYINAHLKNEFKLTYGGMGPTELRIIVILVNTCFIFIRPLREFLWTPSLLGHALSFTVMDIVGVVIALILGIFYLVNLIQDARYYAKVDPRKQ